MNELLNELAEINLKASLNQIDPNELAIALNEIVSKLREMTDTEPKIEFLAGKMSWLVDMVKNNNDTRSQIVRDANEKMYEKKTGVVRAATGVGKSAMIYLDIIRHLMEKNDKRKVFVISTPLLVLNEQFFGDLLETLYGLGLINKDNCIVLNNSSDNQMKKSTVKLVDRNGVVVDTQISKAGLVGLEEKKQITFIVTTHKSFDRLSIAFGDLSPAECAVEIYIDESHTAVIT